jgi:two-component system, OmpR family, copper resistance phosphate regulon response regulator CusR
LIFNLLYICNDFVNQIKKRSMKVLLVEDEKKMATSLKMGLEEHGVSVELAFDGTDGLAKSLAGSYDVIVSDIMMPGITGLELCKTLRSKSINTPVLFLSALSSTDNKVEGLEIGADDYLTKPFEFKELLARIKTLSKRSNPFLNEHNLTVKDLIMNMDARTIKRGEKLIDLTAREFDLLHYFLLNRNRVVSKKELAEKVWDIHFDTGTNVIEVYVNYLRNKIDKEFDYKLIHTVHSKGYLLKDE